ncbi:Rad3-related DNA helicase [Paenibacillus turicensis]|uniref:Rad3-related DNA helicase n=1 Tax=Paenibacillus turicensis TaxID=160487 RepID=A0ABS4FTC8_9BACL|nr:hypothetical protein [Paenibacillus turicensis]MBP1905831.1 Rad3-related DNA helicase [Paenibacillus turicensis]
MSKAVYSMYETVNDYLDLLNYAKQLHDVEWQQAIIQQLKQLHNTNFTLNETIEEIKHIQDTEDTQGLQDVESDTTSTKLWDRLDEINTNMISLFLAISQTKDEEEKNVLLHALHELKQEQIIVSEKLKAQS